MTSYLGKAKNLEDTKPLHSSDTTQVSQIWRDNTHMSYETGRYLAGASVAAKVLYGRLQQGDHLHDRRLLQRTVVCA